MSARGKKAQSPKRSRTMTETAAEGAKALARNPPAEPTPSLMRTKTSAETAQDAAKFLKRSKPAAAKGTRPPAYRRERSAAAALVARSHHSR